MTSDRGGRGTSSAEKKWPRWIAIGLGVVAVLAVVRFLAGRQRQQCDEAMTTVGGALAAQRYDDARAALATANDLCKSLRQAERAETTKALDAAQGLGAANPSATPAVSGRPSLPPEPTPEAASLAGEVPELTLKLDADPAYRTLWSAPRADLNMFLTYVSELLARSAAPASLARAVKAKKLDDAAVKLVLIHARVGKFPQSFSERLEQHLEAVKGEPGLGTWAAGKGELVHDFTALAAVIRRDDPGYQRELIAAKAAGPLGWLAASKPAARPWLVDEAAAFERLALLTDLTPAEATLRDAAQARAKERARASAEEAGALSVEATTLFADYQANEVSADDKYKDKKLLVTGVVASIEKDVVGSIVVWLETPNPLMRVLAKLDDGEKAKAAALTKGGGVRLLCVGGMMVLGSPALGGCTLRQP